MKTPTKQKQRQKRNRDRAMPAPNAFAYTLRDSQAMGGPGRTKLYELDKASREIGERLLFKDRAGRTMVTGDGLRALLGVKGDATT